MNITVEDLLIKIKNGCENQMPLMMEYKNGEREKRIESIKQLMNERYDPFNRLRN